MKTTGNTIFISGGSAGIGLAIAKKLSAAGNKIIINGRNELRLLNALKELDHAAGRGIENEPPGPEHHYQQCRCCIYERPWQQ